MDKTNKENDWFQLFRDGKEDAFRQVFDKYYRPISYFTLKILKEDTFAEDIVSETFRKAWERREKFATPRHLENFLYLVTRNACISHLRADGVHQTTEREWVRISGDHDSGNQPADYERLESKRLEAVFDQLAKLPGADVLRMSFIEGKSTKEIAEELGISENNVYIIKSRTLKTLRGLLSKGDWILLVLLFTRP